MKMRARIGDPKPDRNFVQKQHIPRSLPRAPQIVACAKHQFIPPCLERIPLQHRRIGAPIGVGHGFGNLAVAVARNPVKHDLYAIGRPPPRGIQHMRRQPSCHAMPLCGLA